MKQITVGVGELKISNNSKDLLKTFALGSCVAVIIYDIKKKIAGLIHIALPDSSCNGNKAKELPTYFADTGLQIFLDKMGKKGATRRTSYPADASIFSAAIACCTSWNNTSPPPSNCTFFSRLKSFMNNTPVDMLLCPLHHKKSYGDAEHPANDHRHRPPCANTCGT